MNTDQLLAQLKNPILSPKIGAGTTDVGLPAAGRFVSSIASLLFFIAVIGALIYLILGGLEWVTSGGEKGRLESARNKITNAIIGLIIVAASWAVWILIGKFLGIDVKNLPFPTLVG